MTEPPQRPPYPIGRILPSSATLHSRVLSVYSSLDQEITTLGVGCWIRGQCCDFERNPHVLYASALEISLLLEVPIAAATGPPHLCPFWTNGKCTQHALRPIGCRTHFCDDRQNHALHELHEKYLNILGSITSQAGQEWLYLPFVTAIRTLAATPPP